MPTENRNQEELLRRIVIVPGMLNGKPVVRGMRIAVETIVGLVAVGWSIAELLDSYPDLEREDILACLQYAHRAVEGERYVPSDATLEEASTPR